MADWSIEPFDRARHDRGEFCCGVGSLDHFLRSLVSQYEKRRLGRTYVLVRAGEARILGYYTLAAGAISGESLPEQAAKKLPSHPVPVILLGRLAVDQQVQGQGVGGLLLADSLRRCLNLAQALGVHAVEVDAINETAKAFYEKYGFTAFRHDPLHLFLPIATLQDSLGDAGSKGT